MCLGCVRMRESQRQLLSDLADIILGNIEGTVKGDLLTQTACPVTTRAQSQEQTKALQNPASVFSLPEGDLGRLQANDESLKGWLGKVGLDLEQKGPITFIKENGVLFRIYTDRQGSAHKTLAAPNAIRNKLLWAAHDCPLSGHHGVSKTLKNILSEFSWPGVSRDVVTYVKSCLICQVKAPINRDKKSPITTYATYGRAISTGSCGLSRSLGNVRGG
ncbi:reverse transcriptase [Plakobranchus ocellatus]|uniref:Reverse transcriptase n=1 Tax=Plakobranchus ocellatus TaxID=259542 RepID=A0AAV3YFH8_9GAST|nr:reverse transcriptase [Plakobranchus ocellatus]